MRWLARFVLAHGRDTAAALLGGVLGGMAAAAQPYMVGVVIDHVRRGVAATVIAQDIALLMALAVLTVLAFFVQRYYSGQAAYGINFDIRRTLFDNLLTLDQSFFQRYPTGDLISRMYTDLDMIWRLFMIGLTRFGSAVFTLIVTFILLGLVNLPLTIVVFVVLTATTALQIRAGMILAPVVERTQEQAGVLSALVQDSVSGIQTVKTFGREAEVARKFAQENDEYRRRWLFFKRRNEPVGMLPNMISELTAGVVVLFGGVLTLNGMLTLGNFAQFLIYLATIGAVLLQLGTIYQRYQHTRGALFRITPLLQHANIRTEPHARPLDAPRGDIAFRSVSVRADDAWLLTGISLDIPAGSVVAFVGPTGCGKTLLVSLLARVIDPTEGYVLLDGADVRDLSLEDLRRAVSYVPQSTFLFSQALHDNVRMGDANISDEDLHRAINIARVSNDLPQLPRGLDTLVGERGVMLSGGQKQRVAIARAIVRDPAVLVLDDALSSVDTQTASEILGDLRQVLRTRTSLIIAHRIATVKDADVIVVMNGGRIVERGTHAELIAHNGFYAHMVERELIDETESS